MLLLPLTPPLIYLKLKRFKGPKMDSLSPLQVILQVNSFGKGYGHGTPSTQENKQIIFKGNSFEKGYGHGTPSTEGNHKLFSKEILLKKATDTGHLWSKKTSYFKGKFFWKRDGH